ncbi:MAG: hypothetical protein Q8L14_33500 [Myxococcales bacterium]|nr:hypothetical protein [Myxococcales bacterium]
MTIEAPALTCPQTEVIFSTLAEARSSRHGERSLPIVGGSARWPEPNVVTVDFGGVPVGTWSLRVIVDPRVFGWTPTVLVVEDKTEETLERPFACAGFAGFTRRGSLVCLSDGEARVSPSESRFQADRVLLSEEAIWSAHASDGGAIVERREELPDGGLRLTHRAVSETFAVNAPAAAERYQLFLGSHWLFARSDGGFDESSVPAISGARGRFIEGGRPLELVGSAWCTPWSNECTASDVVDAGTLVAGNSETLWFMSTSEPGPVRGLSRPLLATSTQEFLLGGTSVEFVPQVSALAADFLERPLILRIPDGGPRAEFLVEREPEAYQLWRVTDAGALFDATRDVVVFGAAGSFAVGRR